MVSLVVMTWLATAVVMLLELAVADHSSNYINYSSNS